MNEIKREYAIEKHGGLGCPDYSFINYDGRRFETACLGEVFEKGLIRFQFHNWLAYGPNKRRLGIRRSGCDDACFPDGPEWFVMSFPLLKEWMEEMEDGEWAGCEMYEDAQIILKGRVMLMSQGLLNDPDWKWGIGGTGHITIRRPVGADGWYSYKDRDYGYKDPDRAHDEWMKPRVMGRWTITLRKWAGRGHHHNITYLLYKPQVSAFGSTPAK